MPGRLPHRELVAAAATLLVGCAALLDFEAGTEEGSGGTGAGTTAAATAGTGGTGVVGSSGDGGGDGGRGACDGCLDGDTCVAGDVGEACGLGGDACVACDTGQCFDAACEDGACTREDLPFGTACTGGHCINGVCEPNEDCTDGDDDDDDGFIDCEDDDCDAFAVCLPLVPTGWLGPYAVYIGPEGALCPESWPVPLGVPLATTLAEGAVTCPSCSCSGSCSSYFWAAPVQDCATWTQEGPLLPGDCVALDAPDEVPQQVYTYSSITTCTPQPNGRTAYEANRYDDVVTACGSGPSSACEAGAGLCKRLAPDDPLADERICVAVQGYVGECPAEWTEPIYADGGDALEGRYCSPCSCGDPAVACGGETKIHGDGQCAACPGGAQECSYPDACVLLPAAGYHVGYEPAQVPVCSPVEGTVQGAVSLRDPWTLCCQPLTSPG